MFKIRGMMAAVPLLLAMSAQAADPVTDPKPAAPAEVQKTLDVTPMPERVPCQSGKGWLRKIRVEPSEISYRLKGKTLSPGPLKPASFERIVEQHQCFNVILHGPQRTSCVKKDGEYQCSAARFIQIEKRDGGDWSEKDIAKTLDRYTDLQCCVRRDGEEMVEARW